MSNNAIFVNDGPDKADLLRAVTNPDYHLHVTFRTPTEVVEAHLDRVERITEDGTTFGLRGHLASGPQGAPALRPFMKSQPGAASLCFATHDVPSGTRDARAHLPRLPPRALSLLRTSE